MIKRLLNMDVCLLLAFGLTILGLDSLAAQPPTPSPINGNFSFTDPAIVTDGVTQQLALWDVTTSSVNCPAGFTNSQLFSRTFRATHGWNQSSGPQQGKLTFLADAVTLAKQAQGQAIVQRLTANGLGMGDLFGQIITVTQAGGVNAGGDEGTSATSIQFHQANVLARGKITKVYQSKVNTTTTVAITVTANVSLQQTIPVVSTANLIAGDWCIVDPQTYDDVRQEAVQVVALTPTSITAKFLRPHVAGTPIIGAVVVGGLKGIAGQGRLLVNLAKPSYSAGTCSVANNAFTGTGTTFVSAGLPGATPTNLGCISFAADDEVNPPFGGGASRLRDWYPIISFGDDLHGHFLTRKQVGQQYQGLAGAVPGPYEIRPSAIVMAISPTTIPLSGNLVLSACNPAWWAVGDLCECAISPDMDAVAEMTRIGTYSHGGNYQAAKQIYNNGLRTWYSGVLVGGGIPNSFQFGFAVSNATYGMKIVNPTQEAIYLIGDNTAIHWKTAHGDEFTIGPDPATRSLTFKANGKTALRIDAQGVLHGSIVP